MATVSHITPEKKSLSAWAVPSLFTELDSARGLVNTARSILDLFGFMGFESPEAASSLKLASDYIAGTRTLAFVASWIPDDKGTISACKTLGNKALKGFSTAFSQASDTVSTINFLEKLKIFSLKGHQIGTALPHLKNGLGMAGAVFSLMDGLIAIKNIVTSANKNGITIDFADGFVGKGFVHPKEGTPHNEKAESKIRAFCRDIRNTAISIAKNAFKIALIALAIFGMAAHPVMAFLGLAYGVLGIIAVIYKGKDKKPDLNDPSIHKVWTFADELSAKNRAASAA